MAKLVIVESPAKAKTIARFLGKGYEVQASFGHVRDLPESADEIPAEFKKEKWARLGVNVDNGFEPIYVVPDDKKQHVANLRKFAKDCDELLLATDEDREGESISWHILQLLKPKKSVPVSRIVFHEITPEAIEDALKHARQVDEDLVRAQETRRILDRLYGYTLSPLLWKKVAPKLSAGRVQSVAVRLCVERERLRRDFVSAEYWDLEARLKATDGEFKAGLVRVDQKRVASGRSFDPNTGELSAKDDLLIERISAEQMREGLTTSKPWKVTKVEATPGTESPPTPFMTSTLQQEANRKLRMTSRRTMSVAQQLYEGIELGGERVGLITYMRTDSLNLAERALEQAREVIADLYGSEYLPKTARRYKTKAKGAQEAHEAIRPTDLTRRPQDVKRFLDNDQFSLYELIWKRTIACQMKPAEVERTSVEVEASHAGRVFTFYAGGKRIVFPGFLKAYVEGSDDPDAEIEGRETILPALKVGQELDLKDLAALEHHTRPPARYTEASLVKKLEEEGIGRPSTYASIIGTIQDRGYVFKRGAELVPTFTAFAVTELLEQHFAELVELAFTARMEGELDEIAEGERDWHAYLRQFYHGLEEKPGLARQVESRAAEIPFPAMPLGDDPETGLPVVVRVGRYGTFVQRGEGGAGHRATVPPELPPAELTLEAALDLISKKATGPEAVGVEPSTGRCVFYRTGRFGNYLELAQTEEEKNEKPRRVTLPEGLDGNSVEEADLALLFSLPRSIGVSTVTGQEIVASIGRYGAYIKSGDESRSLENWRDAVRLDVEGADALLSQPKVRGRAARAESTASKEPIKEFGKLEGALGPVKVLAGRYGPYVTDGKTNATIPKGTDPAELTAEQALELLAARASAPKKTVRRGFKRRSAK